MYSTPAPRWPTILNVAALYYQVGGTTELERLELTPELPQSAGIWGSVTLSARHPVHVVDQYVITSVRERKLHRRSDTRQPQPPKPAR